MRRPLPAHRRLIAGGVIEGGGRSRCIFRACVDSQACVGIIIMFNMIVFVVVVVSSLSFRKWSELLGDLGNVVRQKPLTANGSINGMHIT